MFKFYYLCNVESFDAFESRESHSHFDVVALVFILCLCRLE